MSKRRSQSLLLWVALWMVLAVPLLKASQQLPPPPVPNENPITEEKRVLGKILFWEEQLSSDNTVACGTCHTPGRAGTDARPGLHPGSDGIYQTPDDVIGSPGVVRSDALGDYVPDPIFHLEMQITGRSANSALMAAYANDVFWDGRARTQFIDPETNQVSIANGGGLESQAIGPILNTVEMGKESRTWDDVRDKLTAATPLALASDLPADVANVLTNGTDYPDLFQAAFGDPAITAERIAYAMATYERTLIPDQTPWDAFIAGNPNALTQQEQRGWNAFRNETCNVCHRAPTFSDQSFRNIGLRPVAEDRGRQDVTNNPGDRGRFKVPTLRNVGLKTSFMHTGGLERLEDVLDFYLEVMGHQQFRDNQDPLVRQIGFPPPVRADIIAFLRGGLTDPRVANETFPFDRPTLASERTPRNPILVGTGVAGTGGHVPRMIALSSPKLGAEGFKLGLSDGLGGAQAILALWQQDPVGANAVGDLVLQPPYLSLAYVLNGIGAGEGYATWQAVLPDRASLVGTDLHAQWWVFDAAAPNGRAESPFAVMRLY